MAELRFKVPAITCNHCADAIATELAELSCVGHVDIDPVTRWVSVRGSDLELDSIRAAVDSAGHPPDL